MIVRKFRDADKGQLIALWKRVFPDDPPHNDPLLVIEEKLGVDDLIFVAEDDAGIAGACMAGYDGHRGWLYAVAVAPDRRRKRTGTALINSALDALRELGCRKVNLQVRSDNTGVAGFYKSLGFSVEDRMSMGTLI